MKKKYVIIVVMLVSILCSGFSCKADGIGTIDDIISKPEPNFRGIVTEINADSILVKVNDGEDVQQISEIISVPLDTLRESGDFHSDGKIGDKVHIYYDGIITEGNPAQITKVYCILF